MATTFTPAKNAFSRVFLIKRRARGDHAPAFQSCLAAGTVEQSFGDLERIECPDPSERGKFIEIGTIRGATERATTSLSGRYAADLASELLSLARISCAADVQIHFGTCDDPSDFNSFTKIVVLEDAFITNVSTDELGTLESGGQAVVNESADISAREWYEVMQLSFAERGGDVITNEILDAVICDAVGCGDCDDESDGCEKIFAITSDAGGSPGTPADVVFSLDAGATLLAHDIDSLTSGNNPTGIACVGTHIVVVSNDTNSLHYALKSEFDGTTDPTFTEVTTGFVAGGEPNAIWSIGQSAFIVGDGGYIYSTSDATAGVTVLDAGVATVDDLNAVDALSSEFAIAVGNSGAIVKTENGTTWTLSSSTPVGAGIHLNTVAVKSEKEWWVGTNDGRLFYTIDGGSSWTSKTFSGSGSGVVRQIRFSTDSVVYLSHDTTAPRGRLLRSYDGGHSWNVLPEGLGSLPLSDRFTALAACSADPNFVFAGGLADNGTDGIAIVGND